MPWAASEGRRIALVGGEAGSGKSRLVREFAHEAAAGGALVLYGACDAVVRTPYGPFAEALDLLVRAADPADLRADIGAGGGELQRLLPDLAVPRRRAARARRRRAGHRATQAPHRRRRAPDRDGPAPARAARPRGRALGRPPDPPSAPAPRPGRRRRPPAGRRDVPRHRGRRPAGARRRARRPAPERGGRPDAARRPLDRRRRGVRTPGGWGSPREPARAGRVDVRAHGRERVPAHRGVAGAGGDRAPRRQAPTWPGRWRRSTRPTACATS